MGTEDRRVGINPSSEKLAASFPQAHTQVHSLARILR